MAKVEKKFLISIIPFLFFMGILVYCVISTIYTSFTDRMLIGKAAISPTFIGLENYGKIFRDPDFANSLKISGLFTLFSAILGQCTLGLLIAIILKQKKIKFKPFFEICLLFGWLVPDMAAAFMWGSFGAEAGFLNKILVPLGVTARNWLAEAPLTTIIIANIWKGTAWSYLLFSAALEAVPPSYFEAADIDGASAWQKFRFVTVPMVLPVLMTNLLLITIWTFGYFNLIFGMTTGGPGHATEVLPILIYKRAFIVSKLGYGCALSIVMTIIVAALCVVYFWFQRRSKSVT